jgi:hypothetical protein
MIRPFEYGMNMPDPADRMRIPEYVKRELSEVYLLMDHIAGCKDKNLDSALAPPAGVSGEPIKLLDLCKVPWPPSGADPDRAAQLELVLTAKDRLAREAYPATGLSVAFTYLSTATAEQWLAGRMFRWALPHMARVRHRIAPAPALAVDTPPAAGTSTHSQNTHETTIVDFALDAFPGLDSKRGWLTATVWRLTAMLVILLGLTCLTTWNLAIGQRLLADYQSLVKDAKALALQPVPTDAKTPDKAAAGTMPGQPPAAAVRPPPAAPADAATAAAAAALSAQSLIDQRAENTRLTKAVVQKLQAWNCRQGPLAHFLAACTAQKPQANDGNDPQLSDILFNVMNYNVLPVLLGALAATAAALRTIGRKVEANELSPRDLKLVWMRLTLGAFLGAVIGLLITPSGSSGLLTLAGAAAPGSGGADASIPLSPAAYSFLAGFATERIFSWLEKLIDHIFSFGDPKK